MNVCDGKSITYTIYWQNLGTQQHLNANEIFVFVSQYSVCSTIFLPLSSETNSDVVVNVYGLLRRKQRYREVRLVSLTCL